MRRALHIDGLRAVAVLLILGFHGFPHLVPGGYVGVDVFFVISGYLISGIIVTSLQEGRFSFLDFYGRRIRRVFPALALVMATSLVAGWFLLLPRDYSALGKEIAAATLFIPNLLFWSEAGYFDTSAILKPMLHLWSLGVEEQFYVVWPLLLFALCKARWRFRTPIAIITALSLGYACYLIRADPVATFFSPVPRLWELSIGALLATVTVRGSLRVRSAASIIGLCAIVAAAFLLKADNPFPGPLALIPTLGTVLVIWSGSRAAANRYALSRQPLPYVGLVSYPLYLWHWPLLSLAAISHWQLPFGTPLLLSLSFVLAVLTYEFVEKRCQRISLSWVMFQPLALATVGALGVTVFLGNGLDFRYPAEILKILRVMNSADYLTDGRVYQCWLVDERGPQSFASDCLEKQTSLVIWGDSHAATLFPGLRQHYAPAPVGQFTRASCLPFSAPTESEKCKTSNASALAAILSAKPDTLLIYSVWSRYYPNWSADSVQGAALATELKQLATSGIRHVVFLGSPPDWQPGLPEVLWSEFSKTGRTPDRLLDHLQLHEASEQQLKKLVENAGVKYVSLIDLLCNESGCLTKVPGDRGDLIAFDYGHFTAVGAKFVIDQLVAKGEF